MIKITIYHIIINVYIITQGRYTINYISWYKDNYSLQLNVHEPVKQCNQPTRIEKKIKNYVCSTSLYHALSTFDETQHTKYMINNK